jgi:hypothetical protein
LLKVVVLSTQEGAIPMEQMQSQSIIAGELLIEPIKHLSLNFIKVMRVGTEAPLNKNLKSCTHR